MSVEGCWKINFFCLDLNLGTQEIEEKIHLPEGDLIRGPFTCKRKALSLCYGGQYKYVTVLRIYDLNEWKMVFQYAYPNLGTRFSIFSFFSKIPHGIWKIYFDMFSYISKLSRNHSRSMLNFFPVWTPTLNCVIRKKIVLIKWLELIFNGRWSEIHLGFDQKKFDPHILHPKQLWHGIPSMSFLF